MRSPGTGHLSQDVNVQSVKMDLLEARFLSACKSGNSEIIETCLAQDVDVNCFNGWGLRRTVRYHHQQAFELILKQKSLKLNLSNQFGLSALHTACRFNTVDVVPNLLKHPRILLNEPSVQGSTPVMVAIKYGNLEVVRILLKDERVDMLKKDGSGRSLSGLIGVANSNCRNDTKLEIFEIIRTENNRRENLKKKKSSCSKNIAPHQFIVRQAREKVKKLVEEMDEMQNAELMRFKENLENNSREFGYKQQSELGTFMEDLDSNWDVFLERQEMEKHAFLSKLEMRRSVFLSMQKENKEEFYANEEYLQTKFTEKQFDDFASLQMREECKSLTARKSISSCPTWDSQWGYLSGKSLNESKQAGRVHPVSKDNTSRRNSAPTCRNLSGSVSVDSAYLTYPVSVPHGQRSRQNITQMDSQTPSPVPSLEYVDRAKTRKNAQVSITEKVTVKPVIKTPKLTRKSTLDILREEEEKEQVCSEDSEIVSFTNDGITVNKFPSFTNLVTQVQTPSPSRKGTQNTNFDIRAHTPTDLQSPTALIASTPTALKAPTALPAPSPSALPAPSVHAAPTTSTSQISGIGRGCTVN